MFKIDKVGKVDSRVGSSVVELCSTAGTDLSEIRASSASSGGLVCK